MTIPHPTLLTSLFIVAAIMLVPRKRGNFHQRIENVINKIEHSYYETLCHYLCPDNNDLRFWRASQGLRGVYKRVRNLRHYLAIIQIHRHFNMIDLDTASYVWQRVVLMLWFSLLAIPEQAFCLMSPLYPRPAARYALRYYFEILLRVNTICMDTGSDSSVAQLTDLL